MNEELFMIRNNIFKPIVTLAAALSLFAISSVNAASPCKGMDENSCKTSNNQCSWIKSYETKSGNKVQAYCRTKPKKKACSKKGRSAWSS